MTLRKERNLQSGDLFNNMAAISGSQGNQKSL